MNWRECVNSFQFNYETSAYQQVYFAHSHDNPFEKDLDPLLSLEWNRAKLEFDLHCLLIRFLRHSRSQDTMNFDRRANHCAGQIIQFLRWLQEILIH